MIETSEAQAFLAIVAAGSLRAAARERGVDATTLGRWVDRLEAQLGTQLLHRTTRALHPTPAGELFAEQARQLVEQARSIEQAMADLARSPRGRLRLSLCGGYARARLLDPLAVWAASEPELQLELSLEDTPVDLARDGVDLAVRVVPVTSPDAIATALETYPHHVVAAPRWLAAHGAPEHPRELLSRPCLAMRSDRAWTRWPFRREGEVVDLRVRPIAEIGDAQALVKLVEAGAGLTVLPAYLADEALRQGRLVRVLTAWTLPEGTAFAIHARRRRLSAAGRACLAALERAVAGAPSRGARTVPRRRR